MNEVPCLLLENLLGVGQNPPGKPTDEGGNAGIKEIRENGVKVRFTIDNRMRTVSPQWILHSAQVHTYARQENCDGCPHPSQLSVNHAIKWREFNVNSENRETHNRFDLSSKSFGIKFTTSYLSLGVGIFWFFFAIYCLLTQHHMLTSHEFWMIISSAQFVTRSVVGLHCPFILMSIKKPLGLLYSVLWHAIWCSMIICMCLLEKGQSSFCHFSLLIHSICYARSFWNSPLHIFCMLSSLEIPCVLKLQLMHLPLMYLFIQIFLEGNFISTTCLVLFFSQ